MFGSLGLPELLIILLIVIIIFGANKLPQLGRGLGQGMRVALRGVGPGPLEFRRAAGDSVAGSAPLHGARDVPASGRLRGARGAWEP
jgi:sec-independent protein translocase protein TatA